MFCVTERRAHVETILAGASFEPDLRPPWETKAIASDEALVEAVRAWMTLFGPTTQDELGGWLSVDPCDVGIAFARVELSGNVMRGRFTADAKAEALQWCDRVLLARIHRRTVDGLRRAVEPVSPADLMRFYLAWQHVAPGTQARGRDGLLRVIGQLQGFEIAAAGWEAHVLPARVVDYNPMWLDELCFAGEVSWGRLIERRAQTGPTRATPIALVLRRDLPWLLAARDLDGPPPKEPPVSGEILGPTAEAVLGVLRSRGASFFEDLVRRTGSHPAEVEAAL